MSIFIFLWLSDTGAYCVGSLIGKHRLFERISPKKSWEEFYPTAKDAAETEFKGFKVTINSEENGEGRVIVLDLDHPVGVPEKAKDVHSTSFVK